MSDPSWTRADLTDSTVLSISCTGIQSWTEDFVREQDFVFARMQYIVIFCNTVSKVIYCKICIN